MRLLRSHAQGGGMLRYGIPQYRLPKDVLDMEIDIIKETGVEINTGIKIGKDLSLDYLGKITMLCI